MTLPRELSLRVLNYQEKQYRLVSTPIKELEGLRNQLQHIEQNQELNLDPNYTIQLTRNDEFETPLLELNMVVETDNDAHFAICAGNPVNEEVCVGLDKRRWYLDRSKSGNVAFNRKFEETLRATATRELTDKEIEIKIFLDVSSIEFFADGGFTAMTALIYPSQPFNTLRIKNLSPNTPIKVRSYKLWGLNCWFLQHTDTCTESKAPGGTLMSNSVPSILLAALTFTYTGI